MFAKGNTGRAKTKLRLDIEAFLMDEREYADQWMSIKCNTKQDKTKAQSMAYSMRTRGYNIGSIEFDKAESVLWIERKDLRPASNITI